MVDPNDLESWRALAIERGRQLETLRQRLLTAIDSIPDEHLRALVTALDVTHPLWLRDLETMAVFSDPEPAGIESVLNDLWQRVATDAPR